LFNILKLVQEKIIARCLENKIAVYSPHTALDALKGGVNDWLAEAFGTYPIPTH
jgi:putative NIF3 family GTP cyclohydrolase 1 type 2